jgi:hypothetical protein
MRTLQAGLASRPSLRPVACFCPLVAVSVNAVGYLRSFCWFAPMLAFRWHRLCILFLWRLGDRGAVHRRDLEYGARTSTRRGE